jgi:alpha-L-fucosidase
MRNQHFKSPLTFACCILVMAGNLNAQAVHDQNHAYFPPEDSLVRVKLENWQDLKFGLLMHWGTYSQWGIVESWSLCPEDYGWCVRRSGTNPGDYYM